MAPINDDWASATVLTGSADVSTSTFIGSSLEVGEPLTLTGSEHSVWWKWTPSANYYATVETTGSAQSDTTLDVFVGSSLITLDQVASNDDYPGLSNWSKVGFLAIGGTTYYIRACPYSDSGPGNDTGMTGITVTLAAGAIPAGPLLTTSNVPGTDIMVAGCTKARTDRVGIVSTLYAEPTSTNTSYRLDLIDGAGINRGGLTFQNAADFDWEYEPAFVHTAHGMLVLVQEASVSGTYPSYTYHHVNKLILIDDSTDSPTVTATNTPWDVTDTTLAVASPYYEWDLWKVSETEVLMVVKNVDDAHAALGAPYTYSVTITPLTIGAGSISVGSPTTVALFPDTYHATQQWGEAVALPLANGKMLVVANSPGTHSNAVGLFDPATNICTTLNNTLENYADDNNHNVYTVNGGTPVTAGRVLTLYYDSTAGGTRMVILEAVGSDLQGTIVGGTHPGGSVYLSAQSYTSTVLVNAIHPYHLDPSYRKLWDETGAEVAVTPPLTTVSSMGGSSSAGLETSIVFCTTNGVIGTIMFDTVEAGPEPGPFDGYQEQDTHGGVPVYGWHDFVVQAGLIGAYGPNEEAP